MRDALLRLLFRGEDPYLTWKNHTGKVAETEPWIFTGLTEAVLEWAIDLSPTDELPWDLIVEVGSFKGGSAAVIAKEIKSHFTKPCQLLCIDHFLGDTQMRIDVNGMLDWLGMEGGHPTVFDQFMANVVARGDQDIVLPLVASSTVGLRALDRLGLRASLAYLDGAHELEETFLELKLLSRAMHLGAVILGDDMNDHWPAVQADVTRFVKEGEHRLEIAGDGRHYAIILASP